MAGLDVESLFGEISMGLMETAQILANQKRNQRQLHLGRSSALLALLGAVVSLALPLPAARSVEAVSLTYGSLQMAPIAVEDVELFVANDEAPIHLRSLLDILKVDNAVARAIIGAELEVDGQVLSRALDSFVADAFFSQIGSVIDLSESDVTDWLALKNAAITAAYDGKISILEVLKNLEGRLLVIDTRQAIAVARDLHQDVRSLQSLFRSLNRTETATETD